jgi:hypothetical protein
LNDNVNFDDDDYNSNVLYVIAVLVVDDYDNYDDDDD